jgi:phage portal protein BeeE
VAKLTTKKRNKLPDSAFAGPDRSYPVFDKSHAVNAKARATQMIKKGKLTASQKKKIDKKANKILKKK